MNCKFCEDYMELREMLGEKQARRSGGSDGQRDDEGREGKTEGGAEDMRLILMVALIGLGVTLLISVISMIVSIITAPEMEEEEEESDANE